MENGDTGRSISLDEAADQLVGLMEPEEEKAEKKPEEKPEDTAELEAEEPEAEAEETEEPEEATEEVSEESSEITTLSELAQVLEKDPKDLLEQLKATVVVNGKTSEVTLAELQAGYQRGRDYSDKTTALKQQREAFEQQASQARQFLEAQMLQVGQIVQAAEQALIPKLDQAQMDQLRQTNPGEWTARLQEFQAKSQFVESLKSATKQTLEQYRQQAEQARNTQKAQRLEAERAKLQNIPGWGEQMRSDLFEYLSKDYGYTESDLSEVSDHRIIDLVRKARAFDKLQSETQLAVKKVKELPKVIPPGKAETKVQMKRSALEKAKTQLRKSGTRRDAEAVLERILF